MPGIRIVIRYAFFPPSLIQLLTVQPSNHSFFLSNKDMLFEEVCNLILLRKHIDQDFFRILAEFEK